MCLLGTDPVCQGASHPLRGAVLAHQDQPHPLTAALGCCSWGISTGASPAASQPQLLLQRPAMGSLLLHQPVDLSALNTNKLILYCACLLCLSFNPPVLRQPLIFLCVARIEHLASSAGRIEGTRWKINISIIHGNTHLCFTEL